MKKLLLIISLISAYSCNKLEKGQIFGTYKAFYYETQWILTLNSDSSFTFITEGHIGDFKENGKYLISGDTLVLEKADMEQMKLLIDGDSCLIEIETRFDYCKRCTDEYGSRKRSINYPQLSTENKTLKNNVEWMLQTALNNKKILNYLPDTIDTLFIQDYYEINEKSNMNLNWNGKKVKFLSEVKIKDQNIKSYIIIDEFDVGQKTAMINFNMMPEPWHGTLDFFKKEAGNWKHETRN
jgi:hypothetical protein